MQRYGVIDLGTNTFHLLIVEESTKGFRELCRKRVFIKLAENGIETIGQAPFQRGLQTLLEYRKILNEYDVCHVKALGTAALRTASNGIDFVKAVKEQAEIDIQLISGNKEAQLIYLGVRQVVKFGEHNSLIMDIGGGSVEFIIANKHHVYWAQSFPLGVAVLFNRFHKNDPILQQEIQEVSAHLEQVLSPLLQAIKKHPIYNLIGASGTFDVLEQSLGMPTANLAYTSIPVESFPPFSKKIIASSLAERLAMQAIPDSRADLIVVALLLIDFVLKRTDIQQIDVSSYAMKEGMLSEMMQSSVSS